MQTRKHWNFEKLEKTDRNDVFITVKTSWIFHNTRVRCILETWFKLAPDNIYFVTDTADPILSNKTNDHLISTPCRGSHGVRALRCKLAVELTAYSETNYRWFCHFDDDNYVNLFVLRELLDAMDARGDHYIGKRSSNHRKNDKHAAPFSFATGGAGFCLSRALFNKIMPYLVRGLSTRQNFPDDVMMGFMVSRVHAKLKEIDRFHSHLEKESPEWTRETARQQISFSHHYGHQKTCPFRKLHCFLFPDDTLCKPVKK
ncbi:fringe glycosyltransferase [Trichuris trichiura]|uniref:Fringe glycosyltransferase n=1 Tax=Trichuris trichiura TaxID=36087 RepID=A0A077ZDB8_TRITR|nr:fringe glycosyltransferase [Trichuris trichiura]